MPTLRDGPVDATDRMLLVVVGGDIDVHLGGRLRRRRLLLGMSQKQLASACGVKFQQIQKYECGHNRMSAGRLWRLAQALAVPIGYFYDGLNSQKLLER